MNDNILRAIESLKAPRARIGTRKRNFANADTKMRCVI